MQEVRSLNSDQRRDLIEVGSPQIKACITVSPVGNLSVRRGFSLYLLVVHYRLKAVLYKSGPEKDLRMVHSIEMGWFILDKYYALVESTPVYAAAMLLDPSKRKHYLLQNWPEEWRQRLSMLLIRSGRRNTRISLMNHSLPLLLLLISIRAIHLRGRG
ncbi:hypothetical protein FOTG_16253 [Fusarium oxysporum f. sp. vasinfectum 25433]|uniref:Uncharacterized protein n=1 Tax=Fusarium oxysporum f. sp. vasinfectum 25433 TaxID=1089449 RepID=X0KPE3_FUSOX|nr:hypothetical protein FOTG_16253 [Fusarium oxysporum f. sp. vasinfectum 25433]